MATYWVDCDSADKQTPIDQDESVCTYAHKHNISQLETT